MVKKHQGEENTVVIEGQETVRMPGITSIILEESAIYITIYMTMKIWMMTPLGMPIRRVGNDIVLVLFNATKCSLSNDHLEEL